jgi:16S rRNA C967 or C1407 C5-methylase (RsmB/RsmF family)
MLMRALQLLKVGGIVCYSTCTLNPIEAEADVAAALAAIHKTKKEERAGKKQNKPIVDLIEWPSSPGDLVRRLGIFSQWHVAESQDDPNKIM